MMGFVSQLRRWCAAALSAFVLFSPLVAFAASTVSNAYDQPTSLVAGEQGNHHISVTLNGAVSEGELIKIAFDSGFDLSSLIEDDIDIADDTVDLTTAATCSGSEQVGVSISSQIITFDICAGDGGAMTSGSVVDIEIGTNASASGIGASRIENPATTGTYYINVSIGPVGSLVQSGSIPIPIVSLDDADVSAVVSGGGCVSDCDGGWETTEDTITVITPNGGEEYDVGDTIPITWSSEGSGISFVDLYYSTDGGESYTLIVEGTANDGSYTWTAPDVETTLAVVRAEGTDGLDIADTDDSDEVFTIHGTPEEEVDEILILLPAGGESYTSGDTIPVTWTSVGDSMTEVEIRYSTDDGESFTTIVSGEPNDGAYSWVTPTDLVGEDIIVEVIGGDGMTDLASDTSEPFSIAAPIVIPPVETPTITVSVPNGGEVYAAGDTVTITWIASSEITTVDLYYSTDGGSAYTLIAMGSANNGSYTWTAPSVATTQGLILLYGHADETIVSDTSDGTFTITVPPPDRSAITVLVPNGGESYAGGSTQTITWSTSGNSITGATLSYSLDAGGSYTDIVTNTADDGSYDWVVPSVATTQALIRAVGTDGFTAYSTDTSDGVFTITVEVVVVPPIDPTVPPETEVTGGTTRQVSARFLAANDLITLTETNSAVDVLASAPVNVIADVTDATGVTSVVYSYLDEEYEATQSGTASWSYEVMNDGSTTAPLGIVVSYDDGTSITATYTLTVKSRGEVYEYVDGSLVPIEDAVIIIYDTSTGVRTQWDAASFGVSNPAVSGVDGLLGWYVPNGNYVVTAGKTGYDDAEYSASIRNNILSPLIEMEKESVVVPRPPSGGTTTPTTPGETPTTTAPVAESTWQDYVTASFGVVLEALASPAAETTADIGVPIAAVSAAASAALLFSLFDLFPLLQYLFSAPILLFARRRRQAFGVVYHAITKVPIDLAIVRLMNASGKIIRTMVTDKEGRYFFKVDKGMYLLAAIKRGFVFPSTYVGHVKEDGKYLDVYTGGEIQATDQDVLITANIPMDPADATKVQTSRSLKIGRFLRVFQEVIALSGVIASFVVMVIRPSMWTVGLFAINLAIYLLIRVFVKPRKPKGWGIVFNDRDNKKVGNVVVRLFEPKYNKLIESTLTDRQGRYAFMVGPNEYYVTFEKEGFEKREVRPIDYTKKAGASLLSVDVSIRQGKGKV